MMTLDFFPVAAKDQEGEPLSIALKKNNKTLLICLLIKSDFWPMKFFEGKNSSVKMSDSSSLPSTLKVYDEDKCKYFSPSPVTARHALTNGAGRSFCDSQ